MPRPWLVYSVSRTSSQPFQPEIIGGQLAGRKLRPLQLRCGFFFFLIRVIDHQVQSLPDRSSPMVCRRISRIVLARHAQNPVCRRSAAGAGAVVQIILHRSISLLRVTQPNPPRKSRCRTHLRKQPGADFGLHVVGVFQLPRSMPRHGPREWSSFLKTEIVCTPAVLIPPRLFRPSGRDSA